MTTLLFAVIETFFSPFAIGSDPDRDPTPISTDCLKFGSGFAQSRDASGRGLPSRDVIKMMLVNTRNERTVEHERRLILSRGKKRILFFLEGHVDRRESLSRDRLIVLLALLSLYFASFDLPLCALVNSVAAFRVTLRDWQTMDEHPRWRVIVHLPLIVIVVYSAPTTDASLKKTWINVLL